MEKEFIPYEQALALKELGFNEMCLGIYKFSGLLSLEYPYLTNTQLKSANLDRYYSAPLYQQAFRWFREKHNLDSFIKDLYKNTNKVGYYFGIDKYKGVSYQMDLDEYYLTYEEAELECLKKLIELCKKKKELK